MPVGLYKHHKNQGFQKGHRSFVDNGGSNNGMYGKIPHNKKTPIGKECKFCSKLFFVNPYRENIAKYCSHSCRAKTKIGSKNPNWNGGVTSLDKIQRDKFQKTLQQKVLKRDNYICQICGEKNTYFHVNHIEPWSSSPEKRFDIDNCQTLCRKCHFKITFKKDMPENSRWGYKS